MGQIKLKPCPNPDCDGKLEDIETDGTQWVGGQSLYLACEGCGTRGPWCDTEKEATVAWNRLPRVGDGAITITDGEVREDIYFDGITSVDEVEEALNKAFKMLAKGAGLPKSISGKVELEPAVDICCGQGFGKTMLAKAYLTAGYQTFGLSSSLSRELEPAVVDDDSLVAMHQQYDDEKRDDVHKRINGYGKKPEPNDRPTQPNIAPVDKERWPHICTLCDAPAYLAGEGGYSECSNPGCELS